MQAPTAATVAVRRSGGIGRRAGLKIRFPPGSVGSIPTFGMSMVAFVRRSIRAVRTLARDGRIPRPLRALVAIGLLPVPGPFDEAVLLVAAALLFVFYRGPLREAWRASV